MAVKRQIWPLDTLENVSSVEKDSVAVVDSVGETSSEIGALEFLQFLAKSEYKTRGDTKVYSIY